MESNPSACFPPHHNEHQEEHPINISPTQSSSSVFSVSIHSPYTRTQLSNDTNKSMSWLRFKEKALLVKKALSRTIVLMIRPLRSSTSCTPPIHFRLRRRPPRFSSFERSRGRHLYGHYDYNRLKRELKRTQLRLAAEYAQTVSTAGDKEEDEDSKKVFTDSSTARQTRKGSSDEDRDVYENATRRRASTREMAQEDYNRLKLELQRSELRLAALYAHGLPGTEDEDDDGRAEVFSDSSTAREPRKRSTGKDINVKGYGNATRSGSSMEEKRSEDVWEEKLVDVRAESFIASLKLLWKFECPSKNVVFVADNL